MIPSAFEKKFSLGLVLNADLACLERFLSDFHPYIDNFYFSLPLGDKFHSRRRVASQFHDADVVRAFWLQLQLIQSVGIGLEVVFNTPDLCDRDVESGKSLLADHGVAPDKVGLVDALYDAVGRWFPGQKRVYSFNNFPSSFDDFVAGGHAYDEYVVGRQFIRDTVLWGRIRRELKGRVVLLVNNGCSHICGGCRGGSHCLDTYQRSLDRYSAEYLYALQSVMPCELRDGWIDADSVDFIKINSRNTDIDYLRKCLESYIQGHEERYLVQNADAYRLWGNLSWHARWFSAFDLRRIKALKTAFWRGIFSP